MVSEDSFANRFKWLYSDKVDWWFAYTEGIKHKVAAKGFPDEKITAVHNSIDTSELIAARNSITRDELQDLKERLGLGSSPVAVFCGSMYREKKIPFLLQACSRIRDTIKDFQILFIGGGPEAFHVQQASASDHWIHYFGPLFGREKVKHLLLADICLNPGAVGLVILDMLALKVPMMTTYSDILSPEIDYLENGRNGIITPESMDAYVKEAIDLLHDSTRLLYLKQGCEESARKYTIENMAMNFAAGVRDCLRR
jgi:L-malate glycosyltransferase